MTNLYSALTLSICLSIAGLECEGRLLPRDTDTGLLLSALCVDDGRLRQACLEDISSVSIQKFIDKLIAQIKDDDSYGALISELADKDADSGEDDIRPRKRGRNRGQSGFYSNW